jgi:NinB protein
VSRAFLVLTGDFMREKAIHWIRGAPAGTRLEFKEAKRTLPQNDRMWAMLTDISKQKEHCGRRYSPAKWKAVFLYELGQEVEFIPSLDEKTFIPLGLSSSDLGKSEMTKLLDLMESWGAQNGVTFHDQTEAA